MSRFADIAKGTHATKTVELPLPGVDKPIRILIRVLNAFETGSIDATARAYAIAELKKARVDDTGSVPEPKPGDRLYDLGVMGTTCLLACRDPEQPEAPFFASLDEVLGGLDVDRIALLYEEQEAWQDRCAPRPRRLGGEAFMALVVNEAAIEEDAADGPFSDLPRSLQRICFRILARQFVSSLSLKSPSSSVESAESKS